MKELVVKAERKNLKTVISFINRNLTEAGCPPLELSQIEMASEELFINICLYAYPYDRGSVTVRVLTTRIPFSTEIFFIDEGVFFNPTKNSDPDITLSVGDRSVGGLGIFLVKTFMDELEYTRKEGHNIIRFKKTLPSEEFSESCKAYIERMEEIRALSFPHINAIADSGKFIEILTDNARRIRSLTRENQRFLETQIYPWLNSSDLLPEEKAADISKFVLTLTFAGNETSFDLFLALRIAERLIEDASIKGDVSGWIRASDCGITLYYYAITRLKRISTRPEWVGKYRKKGLENGRYLLKLAEKEELKKISDISLRETVLTDFRFFSCLYEGIKDEPELNKENIRILTKALDIAHDKSYHDLVPGFDWDYYLYRVYEYFAYCTDGSNSSGFDREDLSTIYEMTKALKDLSEKERRKVRSFSYEEGVQCLYLRNSYLAEKIGRDEYLNGLIRLHRMSINGSGRVEYAYASLMPAMEYIIELEKSRITTKDEENLRDLYLKLFLDLIKFPGGTYLMALDFFAGIILHFLDISPGMSFEDMCLRTLAVLNPGEYVHSRMVGRIAECLTGHLIEKEPELFTGMKDCHNVKEVSEMAPEIKLFAYHAALTHDIGKIPMADVLLPCGRELYPFEKEIIGEHAGLGAFLLEKHPSTREYAYIAKWHHLPYDGGNEADRPERDPRDVVRYIVTLADRMDKATDPVNGHDENVAYGKFLTEAEECSGKTYAPYLVQLLKDKAIEQDIQHLLGEGRRSEYIRVCQFIRGLSFDRRSVERELENAKSIQIFSLPGVFPAFEDRDEFDIHATMTPSKQIGGDFYDFFFVDDSHFAVVMADVSGKGIPAAMFMMRAKSTIKSMAVSGVDISELFDRVNALLCENNKMNMFVTVWLGVLDLESGVMKYINAGHTQPLIRHGGEWRYMTGTPDFVLGGLDDTHFHVREFAFERGDVVILYTDGVTEAQDARYTLFGEERLISVVANIDDINPKKICDTINKKLELFVGDSPQMDDITLLALSIEK